MKEPDDLSENYSFREWFRWVRRRESWQIETESTVKFDIFSSALFMLLGSLWIIMYFEPFLEWVTGFKSESEMLNSGDRNESAGMGKWMFPIGVIVFLCHLRLLIKAIFKLKCLDGK